MHFQNVLKCTVLASAVLLPAALPAVAQEGKTYEIYLSNNFVGNDWRQQMLRSAEAAITKPPLAGRVNLRIENVENAVQAQINSLNNMIRERPDAILIDSASAEGLNPTIRRACDEGILVISFDQVVTEECAFALASDWDMIPAVMAEWLATQMGGKGKVFVDRGLAGAPISAQLQEGYEAVLAKYPDIEIVGYFNGDYALGPEQAGVAALLAANPQVDGILTQGYGAGAIQALVNAGRPMVPVVGGAYNVSALTCLETEGANCILMSNPAYMSAEAIKLAVEILDTGVRPAERSIVFKGPMLTNTPMQSTLYPDQPMEKLELGLNAFPDQPPGLGMPITPEWVEITAAEAAGTN